MKFYRFIALVWFCALSVSGSAFMAGRAVAQGIPVFDASNLANTLLTAERSLEQINNQLKMIESLGFDASGDLSQILSQTTAVLNQVEGMTYNVGQISEQFANAYPENMDGMTYDDLVSLKDSVLIQTRDAQKHAMELQASVAGSIPQTQTTVDALVAESNAAPGTTAAVQANTQLLATLSTQISQMQTLLMAQTRALNAYIQEQNTRSSIAEEQRSQMFDGIERVEPRSDGVNPLNY